MFLNRKDVEIWVHDKELRSTFWSVATGADVGVYGACNVLFRLSQAWPVSIRPTQYALVELR